MRNVLLRLPHWIAALVVGSLLGLLGRLLLFVAATLVVRGLAGLAGLVLGLAPSIMDPVYTHAALRSLYDVRLQGLAVAGPPGEALHALLPGLVLDPAAAQAGWVRIVVEPGSAILGRLVAAGLAHAAVLSIGVLLVRAGWARRRLWLVVVGVAAQLQVAAGIIAAQPSVRELEATGISFAVNAFVPWLWARSQSVTDALAPASQPLAAAALVGLALLVGYVPAAVVVASRGRRLATSGSRREPGPRTVALGTALVVVLSSAACAGVWQAGPAPGLPGTARVAGSGLSPREKSNPAPAPSVSAAPLAAAGPTHRQAEADVLAVVVGTALPDRVVFGASDAWFSDHPSMRWAGPSHVEVQGRRYQYQLVVDGEPLVIQGMGLNTQYTQTMTPDERAARLDADLAAMQLMGVNTVLGWNPDEFDETLLDRAFEHGIRVVVPFDIDPATDFTDPSVRAALTDQVMDWVERYRDHPGLLMWGLGNEVLHKIVHPAWVGPEDPQRVRQARAFADWLVATADAIHAADPDHPVTYREAEDAFVSWIVGGLQRRGGGPRPWFVFGTNCYTDYLSQIVDRWPSQGMDTALWVSEFAPAGLEVPDRPDGFQRMWGDIRRHPAWVLGGAAYAWTRNGPEGVDRDLGLTDDGVPVDGRSLDMLADLFHTE